MQRPYAFGIRPRYVHKRTTTMLCAWVRWGGGLLRVATQVTNVMQTLRERTDYIFLHHSTRVLYTF